MTKSKKVVDVPIVCGACGNKDWRRFRHRSESLEVDDKPRTLLAVCEHCGSEHIFDEGEWKKTGVISSEKLRIAALKSGWIQTISDLPGTSRKLMDEKSGLLFYVLGICQGRVQAYRQNQTNVVKLLHDVQMTRDVIAEFLAELKAMHGGFNWPQSPDH
jgi:hypothetical protein